MCLSPHRTSSRSCSPLCHHGDRPLRANDHAHLLLSAESSPPPTHLLMLICCTYLLYSTYLTYDPLVASRLSPLPDLRRRVSPRLPPLSSGSASRQNDRRVLGSLPSIERRARASHTTPACPVAHRLQSTGRLHCSVVTRKGCTALWPHVGLTRRVSDDLT